MPVTSTVHLVLFQGETLFRGMTVLLFYNAQIEILTEKSFVFTKINEAIIAHSLDD